MLVVRSELDFGFYNPQPRLAIPMVWFRLLFMLVVRSEFDFGFYNPQSTQACLLPHQEHGALSSRRRPFRLAQLVLDLLAFLDGGSPHVPR